MLLPLHAEALLGLSLPQWERALTLGRLHRMAARWYRQLEERDLLDALPARVRDHLWSEHLLAEERARMVRWEVDRLAWIFEGSDLPIVLLKGAAYIMADLPPGRGRQLSDVDILVPSDRLAEAEAQLRRHGWQFGPLSAYDEHYYRSWMHELPPLHHVARGSTLDVHHRLLPRTARVSPDPTPVFADAEPLPESPLRIPGPADLVLHSILHGFETGEFTNGWRDLLDVHELIDYYQRVRHDFWLRFASRVLASGAARPVWHALTLASQVHGTVIPPEMAPVLAAGRPPAAARLLVQGALHRSLVPGLPPTAPERLALRVLYLRSHWNRMPPRLLARHGWTKLRARRHPSPAEP